MRRLSHCLVALIIAGSLGLVSCATVLHSGPGGEPCGPLWSQPPGQGPGLCTHRLLEQQQAFHKGIQTSGQPF